MELSKKRINITKGVAILFMLLLHLFCTKQYQELFTPIVIINKIPLIYYLSLFGDMCVAIYCFCSGYGLMIGYKNNQGNYIKKNLIRILKLYINFWIILILFVVVLGPIMGKGDIYPGNIKTFLLTFTGINTAYNGAWWFISIYIILVLLSPYINKVVLKYKPILILGVSFIIYFVGYIQRIITPIVVDSEIINYILRQAALWGTSQLPYVVGCIFAHEKIYSKINSKFNKLRFKNLICISLIGFMIVAHGFIETLFVAIFTGIAFIVLFNMIDKPRWLDSILVYISKHSTNMWLTHMFFYMIYFKEVVFAPKYPIFIFVWLVILCIASSYIINLIYYPIIKVLDNKINQNREVTA